MPEYFIAKTDMDYEDAAALFREYAAWLEIDLCFQHFGEELQRLPQMYGPPEGAIFLCRQDGKLAGCVGVRRFNDTTAELKRMWVRSEFRSLGIGETLLQQALDFAKKTGYPSINLDTLAVMTPAISLYKKYGFEESAAYYDNPHPDARYFSKKL
jgi:ribosomal protein S18 acetylase RimI-like enzyme